MRPISPDARGNANMTPSPSVAAVAVEFPPHQVGQGEALSGLTGFCGPQFDRFGASAGVENRRIAMPLAEYGKLSGFTEANDIFIEAALELGERALSRPWTPPRSSPPTSMSCSRRRSPGWRSRHWKRGWRPASACDPMSSGCRCSVLVVSPAPPGWRACTTICGLPRSGVGPAGRRTVLADAAA